MHQQLARSLKSRLRCHVVQQYSTIGPDGRNSGYLFTFDRNKNSVSSDPSSHIVRRLVAEPHRKSGQVTPVIEIAQFLYRPSHDVDCMVGIRNLSWPNLHFERPLRNNTNGLVHSALCIIPQPEPTNTLGSLEAAMIVHKAHVTVA
ncbi:hypothetical protein [Bradyrhizobium iriomotense]|uniref:hypothetical protein n=1 Tax=Bradyrhizobium iriomotense TaxID=441950 RepID=UPI0024E1461F|nr:hypothetical protein [Bradyrhizobium iriomotense]